MLGLEERRIRKREAAERYAHAQMEYMRQIYEREIAPHLQRVFTGVCISVHEKGKTAEVRIDADSPLLAGQVIEAAWYTATLSKALLLQKRVKVIAEPQDTGEPVFVLAAIME